MIEEAAALMESLANNHVFLNGDKRISFVMTDVMLRANGYFLHVEPLAAHKFITEALNKNEFWFPIIREWLASIAGPAVGDEE